ncbi:MAG: prolipoprotein diacylglyceryl transferase family protein [Candidatus Peregrinibacteria bacterium]
MPHITFPVGISIGENFLPIHFFFEVLAFYLGISYYYHLRASQKDHFSESQRLTLLVSACIGALLGSRLLAALEHYQFLVEHFSWFSLTQSKTIVGGIIGGWIGIETAKKFMKITTSSGDLFTFPLIFAIIVGRIGCALTGVSDGTAGDPSDLPWAFDQGDGIARHPTALYEILFLGIFWAILLLLKQKFSLQNGDLFKFFMVGYSLWRVLVEFIKPVDSLIFGLSAIQIACVFVLLYYVWVFIKRFYPPLCPHKDHTPTMT